MKRYEKYKAINLPWLSEIPIHWALNRNKVFLKESKDVVGESSKDYNLLSLTKSGIIPRDVASGKGKFPSDFSTYKIICPGDMVFCLFDIDETPRTVGLSSHHGMLTGAYDVFHVTAISSKYMLYYYLALDDVKAMRPLYKGLRKTINVDTFLGTKLPVPPRDEQDQIVRYLDWQVSKINRLIAAKRKQIELMKDTLKSAVAKLTTHGIGSHDMCRSEIYWLTEYPSTWHVTKLKYILKKHRREVPPNAELLICSNSGEVTKRGDGKLGLVAASDDIYQGVKTGDLLIHGMDTWHGAIAISNFDGMCTPVVHVCTCREEKRFVAYYLKMMAYTKVFKAISNGVRQNTSDFRSWDKVGDLLICLPDISEQVAIADELDKLTDATKKGIACFERHIEKLVDLRTRLISDVVTGQIDVRGIEVPDYEHYDEAPENATEESSDSDYDTEE